MPTTLITGANRGIGLELARQYLAEGWRVHATCRNPNEARELKDLSGDLSVHEMDVTLQHEIDAVSDRIGGEAVDLLINNAGIADNYGTGVLDGKDDPDLANYDYDVWAEVLKVNVLGQGRVTGAFADNVAASDKKIIAMMASGLSSMENTWMGGRYAYRTSKAALNMMMRGAGAWLEPRGVIVVSIAPGWTKTDLGGPNAVNTVEEACEGMRAVLDKLTVADTGTYWNFDGRQLPW